VPGNENLWSQFSSRPGHGFCGTGQETRPIRHARRSVFRHSKIIVLPGEIARVAFLPEIGEDPDQSDH
jgi:hypothetical protein